MASCAADYERVCTELGLRYLWVDRYCIDQSDPRRKHELASQMDRIDAGAAVTIIAAAGTDPFFGLPGVSTTPRKLFSRRFGPLGQDCLILPAHPAGEVEESVWTARGWNYQEALLSRRRLVFTESQVYFQCQTGDCVEIEELESDSCPDFPRNIFSNHIGCDQITRTHQRIRSAEGDLLI